jgi:diguanylate cyclase (GGDEF)-like protein
MNGKYYKKKLTNKDIIIEKYKKELVLLKNQLEIYKEEVYRDSLTKLNNRRSLNNREKYSSIIFCDVDYFKKINDKYGHYTGDRVLIEISNILKESVRKEDLVCRWGGEEFLILLKECNVDETIKKAVSIKQNMKQVSKKFGFPVTMSFGISILENSLDTAIVQADKAMYKSKTNGRNRITIYSQK